MHTKRNLWNTINIRILIVLLILFIATAGIVGVVNTMNIRGLYEESYTERLLLTNALMGSIIRSEDIEYFVNLMKSQDDGFKQRQVDFYHDREELFRLQRESAPQEEQQEILKRLAIFHEETQKLKNSTYWDTLEELKELKEISRSTYVYVMADIGLTTRDGESLYTYIFDAEDEGEYSSPDMDGLGTSDIGNEAFNNVFRTKKQTEQAELYEGDLGELYFVCVPILSKEGDVVAVLGTDLSLDGMNSAIASSTLLFNNIISAVFVISIVAVFSWLSRRIVNPLSSLTKTALTFAEGNLHTSISEEALKQRTEIGTLAHAFRSTLDATTLYLNSIPESLFIMNRKCETSFRNDQYIKRFGDLQAKEFMLALFPEDTEAEIEEMLKQSNNSAIVWIDGSCFAVMLKEIVLTDMAENSILVIANDITDLVREKENAQAAAAAKSSFLSRMSHEMRTPMNAIIGMTRVAGDTDSMLNIKYCLSIIHNSSEQLLSIINDVLDMSKIEAGKLKLETAPTSIEKVLVKVSGIFCEVMEKKKQTFSTAIDQGLKPYYLVDELRLIQVLSNLLSNATKFVPEGGAIALTVRNVGRSDKEDLLCFSVSDTGIGMTEAQITRLFNAFEQADGGITRKFGGMGLGLTISQSIVEKMGGRIEVESEPGVGSVFCFTIALEPATHQDMVAPGDTPLEEARMSYVVEDGMDSICIAEEGLSAADIASDEKADLSGIRVLLAEDIEINREIFIALMEGTNLLIDVAENGIEAVAKFKENPESYDFIFLDIQMPEMDGYEATKAIRRMEIPEAATIPIVAMSANAFKEDVEHSLESGMNDHLAKPIDAEAVIEMILRYTKRRQSSRSAMDS